MGGCLFTFSVVLAKVGNDWRLRTLLCTEKFRG